MQNAATWAQPPSVTRSRCSIDIVADAVTVNPYLGPESLRPFLKRTDSGVIMLCRTSNPENAWLQDYPDERSGVPARRSRGRRVERYRQRDAGRRRNVSRTSFGSFATQSATCRCSFPASALKAATSKRPCAPVSTPTVRSRRSMHHAAFCMHRAAPTSNAAARDAVISLRNEINRVRGVEL